MVYPTSKSINAKVSFFHQCSDQWSHSKNLSSYFHWYFYQNTSVCNLYALVRIKWILDIIWTLNQHFNLKNQRNWKVWMINFLSRIICILLHWWKKLTLSMVYIFDASNLSIKDRVSWTLTLIKDENSIIEAMLISATELE